MKVKRNAEKEEKFFTMCPGTVFLSGGGIPYMKTDTIETDYDDTFNAVVLKTGEFDWFDEDDLVHPCYEAELLIP